MRPGRDTVSPHWNSKRANQTKSGGCVNIHTYKKTMFKWFFFHLNINPNASNVLLLTIADCFDLRLQAHWILYQVSSAKRKWLHFEVSFFFIIKSIQTPGTITAWMQQRGRQHNFQLIVLVRTVNRSGTKISSPTIILSDTTKTKNSNHAFLFHAQTSLKCAEVLRALSPKVAASAAVFVCMNQQLITIRCWNAVAVMA